MISGTSAYVCLCSVRERASRRTNSGGSERATDRAYNSKFSLYGANQLCRWVIRQHFYIKHVKEVSKEKQMKFTYIALVQAEFIHYIFIAQQTAA